MNVLVAPDSFKGSLSALQVGEAISRGVKAAVSNAFVKVVPMADGGEGTISALAFHQEAEKWTAIVSDPLLRPVEATCLKWKDSAFYCIFAIKISFLQFIKRILAILNRSSFM